MIATSLVFIVDIVSMFQLFTQLVDYFNPGLLVGKVTAGIGISIYKIIVAIVARPTSKQVLDELYPEEATSESL